MVLLTRISRFVYRRATPDVLGMRAKSFIALTHLRSRPGVSQKDLSDAIMIDANNTVLLLNDLEAEGWATRERDPADRRRHVVRATPAGLDALAQAEAALDRVEAEVLSHLTEEERATLRTLLDRALNGAVVPEDEKLDCGAERQTLRSMLEDGDHPAAVDLG
jgi:DNA-binding MarR family transcriptional regulator